MGIGGEYGVWGEYQGMKCEGRGGEGMHGVGGNGRMGEEKVWEIEEGDQFGQY